MILSKEQFCSCLTGVSAITEDHDGYLLLNRFVPEQIAIYPPDHKWVPRSYSQSSVTLDFHTDSTALTLHVRKVGCWEAEEDADVGKDVLTAFELYENGVFTRMMQATEDGRDLTVSAKLSPGEKRVTVYVPRPQEYQVSYGDMVLEDGASFRKHTYACNYVAFGDSITNGDVCGHSSMIYVNQVSRMLNARTHNFAIGGMRYLENTIIPGTYPDADIVTVSYGTNDYHNSESTEVMCRECRGFFDKLLKEFPHAEIFVLLPIWRKTAEEVRCKGDLRQTVATLRAIIEQYPVKIIDCFDFVPHVECYYVDGLHPNDLGTAFLGQQVCRALEHLKK